MLQLYEYTHKILWHCPKSILVFKSVKSYAILHYVWFLHCVTRSCVANISVELNYQYCCNGGVHMFRIFINVYAINYPLVVALLLSPDATLPRTWKLVRATLRETLFGFIDSLAMLIHILCMLKFPGPRQCLAVAASTSAPFAPFAGAVNILTFEAIKSILAVALASDRSTSVVVGSSWVTLARITPTSLGHFVRWATY